VHFKVKEETTGDDDWNRMIFNRSINMQFFINQYNIYIIIAQMYKNNYKMD